MNERQRVPSYFVYGEPERALDVGFLHVETVMERKSLHFGRVPAHKHPHMGQITFWFAGEGRYTIEDETWIFSAPAVGFVPSDVVHGFEVVEQSDALVVSISNDVLNAIAPQTALNFNVPVFISGQQDSGAWPRLRALLDMIGAEYREQGSGDEKLLTGLIVAVLCLVQRLGGGSAAPATEPEVKLALDLRRTVDRHFRENWTMAQYVEALSTTPHLLDRATRSVFGRSAKEMVTERRLLEARRLLMFTIRPVEDIGREIGIDDPSYFSRFFRRHMGEAPSAWRRRHPYAREA